MFHALLEILPGLFRNPNTSKFVGKEDHLKLSMFATVYIDLLQQIPHANKGKR